MTKNVEKNDGIRPGVGVDLGTMNIVSARQSGDIIGINRIRDAFLDLPIEHKRMLKLSNTGYVEKDNRLIVIGDEAIDTANLFNREARRPLSSGLISAGELEAQWILSLILGKVLGKPIKENEICYYSVPAASVDVQNSDVTYHRLIFKKILEELGYGPVDANEALAIVTAECAKENFSGLAISYGAGTTNICLCYNAMSALEISYARGGDWCDHGAAKAIGTTAAKICKIKESDIDITNPKNREEEAVSLYLQTLIDYTIDNIVKHFHKAKSEILIPKPIPIIISGGTSKAGGFVQKFKERFDSLYRDKFPIQISEIRQAQDPMTAVAVGLLMLAQMED